MKKDKVQETKSTQQHQLTATDFLPDNFRSRITPQVLKSRVIPMVDSSVQEYQTANRKIVKSCAKKYIRANVVEHSLLRFMLGSIKYEHMDFMMCDNIAYDLSEYEESEYITDIYSNKIRRDARWFNDLMLYLSGTYTDGQLLNADFFRVINNQRAKRAFIENTKRIDVLNHYRARCSEKIARAARTQIEKSVCESQQIKQK